MNRLFEAHTGRREDRHAATTRKGEVEDINAIKALAEQEKDIFGFITRGTLLEALKEGQVMVVVLNNHVVGFQHYYHRKKDAQTTLYHKVIGREFRGRGFGRLLVNSVAEEAKKLRRSKLVLKCPVGIPSNEFHRRYGFNLIRVENGKKRKLNVWELNISEGL